MPNSGNRPPSAAEANAWFGRAISMVVIMVLPIIAGKWLDDKFGTKFIALLGIVFGVGTGLAYIILITSSLKNRGEGSDSKSNLNDKQPTNAKRRELDD